jgi:hypothetical protein
MRTVQCPRCQLRFRTPSEALWHLRWDHYRTPKLELPRRLRGPTRQRHTSATPVG